MCSKYNKIAGHGLDNSYIKLVFAIYPATDMSIQTLLYLAYIPHGEPPLPSPGISPHLERSAGRDEVKAPAKVACVIPG